MSALTKKQIRDAAPPDQLPFQVTRKYGDPKLLGTWALVRNTVLADLDDLADMHNRWASVDMTDRFELARLRTEVEALTEDHLPVTLSAVVDSYSGVKYEVTIVDRRKQ